MNCCPTNISIIPLPLLLSQTPGPDQSNYAFPSLHSVLGSARANHTTRVIPVLLHNLTNLILLCFDLSAVLHGGSLLNLLFDLSIVLHGGSLLTLLKPSSQLHLDFIPLLRESRSYPGKMLSRQWPPDLQTSVHTGPSSFPPHSRKCSSLPPPYSLLPF